MTNVITFKPCIFIKRPKFFWDFNSFIYIIYNVDFITRKVFKDGVEMGYDLGNGVQGERINNSIGEYYGR